MSNISEPMKTLKEIHNGKTEMYKAFIAASQKFKIPELDKSVKYNSTNFEYSTLKEILNSTLPYLLEEGFFPCHEFYDEGGIHWIKTYLQYKNGNTLGNVIFPIAIAGKKMQEIGSQITYLRRYSILAICGVIGDADSDGSEVIGDKIVKKISEADAKEIQKLLANDKTSWEMLQKEYGVSKITDITTNRYKEIVTALKLLNAKNKVEANKEKSDENI